MKSLTFAIAAFSIVVGGQLTLDAFNSILGEAAEDAGIPQCGLSCLNDAFSFSKTSRGCFVNSGNLECLCDDDDIAGSLMLCSDRVCGATESATVQYSVQKLCENRPVVSSTSSTSSSASIASSTEASFATSTVVTSTSPPASPSSSSSDTPALQDPNYATPYSSSTSLSTGAKAGIGAGASALTLLALLLAFFLIRRHKRKPNSIPLEILTKPPSYHEDQKAELMGSPATPGSGFTVSPRSDMGLGVFENGKQQDARREDYLAGRYGGENYQYQRDGEVAELGGDGPVELAGGDECRRDPQPKVVTEPPSLIALNLQMPNSRSRNC